MKTGIYVLTSDVTNPDGDNRRKYNYWKLQTWKAGTKFVVEAFDESPDHTIIRPAGRHESQLTSTGKLEGFLPHLQPIGMEDIDSVLLEAKELSSVTTDKIVRHMVEAGILSLTDLRKMIETISGDRKS